MSTTRESGDVVAIAAQVEEHVGALTAVLAAGMPPSLHVVKQAMVSTRALRGSALLAGFDPFQSFLGRVFQLLEHVDSGVLPWSTRLTTLLEGVIAIETHAIAQLERGAAPVDTAGVEAFEAAVAALHGTPAPAPDADAATNLDAVPAGPPAPEVEAALQQIQLLRQALATQALPVAARNGSLATLEREIAMLQEAIRAPHTSPPEDLKSPQEGLRNHCEGALRNLVEAAAQEVLEEARERGLRLAMRITGALDPVDDDLGAALLELLAYFWSDALDAQAAQGGAEIDTVLRSAEDRLIVEFRDVAVGETSWRGASPDDDVLGRYAGLRRSRPLVESLHGMVEVEPAYAAGCRFRLSLPLSTLRPHAMVLRVGRHEIAVASSSIAGVYEAQSLRADFDAAGAFVEVGGMRVPILHLAFALHDVGYDELVREHVVVVGSFERRAAIFASQAHRSIEGRLTPEAQGLWAGTLETERGIVPMLHVGALLGRCGPAEVVPAPPRAPLEEAAPRGPVRVLLVVGAGAEREAVAAALALPGCTVRAVDTVDAAWTALEAESADLVVCDLRLPEMHAQQFAERRRVSGQFQEVPMLLVLSHAGEQSHLVVQQLGAAEWVRSPVDAAEILESVRRLVAV